MYDAGFYDPQDEEDEVISSVHDCILFTSVRNFISQFLTYFIKVSLCK